MSINCIRAVLEDAVQSHGDKTAIILNEKSMTYRELFKRVNQVAFYLQELELPKNSRIGVYSNKGIEQVIAILSILSTDYVLVPLTKTAKAGAGRIHHQRLRYQVYYHRQAETRRASRKIDFDGHVIAHETTAKDVASFEEIYKYYNKSYSCDINGHDNAVITYSFGLTGKPKGIVISHRNLIESARVVSQYLNLQQDDIVSGSAHFQPRLWA